MGARKKCGRLLVLAHVPFLYPTPHFIPQSSIEKPIRETLSDRADPP